MPTSPPPRGARFADRTAWVTGAGSGIGRATAGLLAREGATVFCLDRDVRAAEAAAAEITAAGGEAWPFALDVADEAAWPRAVDALRGPLTIAVHCAGISFAAPIDETTLDDWRRVLAVNLDGVFLGTRHAVVAMRAHGRPASIVNIASLSGLKAQPGAAAYCASKAAVIHFSKAVALECRAHGDPIRVNTVSPGGVKTPMWRTMPFFEALIAAEGSEEAAYAALARHDPHSRFAAPEEIAAAIAFLASDAASFVTGTDFAVDLGGSA